jgi:uncharacterized protein
MKTLTEAEALGLLKKEKLPQNIIEHCRAVSKKAVQIAEAIKKNGWDVDVELVRIAGLLHDLGRSRTHEIEHGIESGKILRELGYPEIAQTAERHCTLLFKRIPLEDMSIEEKIICYADGVIEGSCEVSFEERHKAVVERRKAHGKHKEVELFNETKPKYDIMVKDVEYKMGHKK